VWHIYLLVLLNRNHRDTPDRLELAIDELEADLRTDLDEIIGRFLEAAFFLDSSNTPSANVGEINVGANFILAIHAFNIPQLVNSSILACVDKCLHIYVKSHTM
jgi:hypothetical protein